MTTKKAFCTVSAFTKLLAANSWWIQNGSFFSPTLQKLGKFDFKFQTSRRVETIATPNKTLPSDSSQQHLPIFNKAIGNKLYDDGKTVKEQNNCHKNRNQHLNVSITEHQTHS